MALFVPKFVYQRLLRARYVKNRKVEILVRWMGMDESLDTWEPLESIPQYFGLSTAENVKALLAFDEQDVKNVEYPVDTGIYVIEKILFAVTDASGRIFVYIKWDHYSISDSTWEPIDNIKDYSATLENLQRIFERTGKFLNLSASYPSGTPVDGVHDTLSSVHGSGLRGLPLAPSLAQDRGLQRLAPASSSPQGTGQQMLPRVASPAQHGRFMVSDASCSLSNGHSFGSETQAVVPTQRHCESPQYCADLTQKRPVQIETSTCQRFPVHPKHNTDNHPKTQRQLQSQRPLEDQQLDDPHRSRHHDSVFQLDNVLGPGLPPDDPQTSSICHHLVASYENLRKIVDETSRSLYEDKLTMLKSLCAVNSEHLNAKERAAKGVGPIQHTGAPGKHESSGVDASPPLPRLAIGSVPQPRDAARSQTTCSLNASTRRDDEHMSTSVADAHPDVHLYSEPLRRKLAATLRLVSFNTRTLWSEKKKMTDKHVDFLKNVRQKFLQMQKRLKDERRSQATRREELMYHIFCFSTRRDESFTEYSPLLLELYNSQDLSKYFLSVLSPLPTPEVTRQQAATLKGVSTTATENRLRDHAQELAQEIPQNNMSSSDQVDVQRHYAVVPHDVASRQTTRGAHDVCVNDSTLFSTTVYARKDSQDPLPRDAGSSCNACGLSQPAFPADQRTVPTLHTAREELVQRCMNAQGSQLNKDTNRATAHNCHDTPFTSPPLQKKASSSTPRRHVTRPTAGRQKPYRTCITRPSGLERRIMSYVHPPGKEALSPSEKRKRKRDKYNTLTQPSPHELPFHLPHDESHSTSSSSSEEQHVSPGEKDVQYVTSRCTVTTANEHKQHLSPPGNTMVPREVSGSCAARRSLSPHPREASVQVLHPSDSHDNAVEASENVALKRGGLKCNDVMVPESECWTTFRENSIRSIATIIPNNVALQARNGIRCYCSYIEHLSPSEEKLTHHRLSHMAPDIVKRGLLCTICSSREHVPCSLSWKALTSQEILKKEINSLSESFVCVACRLQLLTILYEEYNHRVDMEPNVDDAHGLLSPIACCILELDFSCMGIFVVGGENHSFNSTLTLLKSTCSSQVWVSGQSCSTEGKHIDPLERVTAVCGLTVIQPPTSTMIKVRVASVRFHSHPPYVCIDVGGTMKLQLRACELSPSTYKMSGFPHHVVVRLDGNSSEPPYFILKAPEALKKRKESPLTLPLSGLSLRKRNRFIIESTFQNSSSYLFAVVVVSSVSCDALLKTIEEKSWVSFSLCKDITYSIIHHTNEKFNSSDDIMFERQDVNIVSLRCPSTLMRIKLPGKGVHCRHIQCFDIAFYISSQPRIGSHRNRWRCPVCYCFCYPHEIILDTFFNDILSRTTEEDRTVVLIPTTTTLTWNVIEKDESLSLCDKVVDVIDKPDASESWLSKTPHPESSTLNQFSSHDQSQLIIDLD